MLIVIKGRNFAAIIRNRIQIRCLWPLLVRIRRYRSDSVVCNPRDRAQAQGAQRSHVPGSHSRPIWRIHTCHIHGVWTDDQHLGHGHAAYRRKRSRQLPHRNAYGGRLLLAPAWSCYLHHVWRHQVSIWLDFGILGSNIVIGRLS